MVDCLPEGMSPDEAVRLFEKNDGIKLQPLKPHQRYFTGWFDKKGREVRTVEGDKLLFTIFLSGPEDGYGYRLRLSKEAQLLLATE